MRITIDLSIKVHFLWITLAAATVADASALDRTGYIQPYKSAANMGHGDTGIATADYEDALFYNPAGLGLYEAPPLTRLSRRIRTFEENINGPKESEGLYKRLVLVSPMGEASELARELYQRATDPESDPVELTRSVIGRNIHGGFNNFTGIALRRIAVGAFASASADAMVFKNPEFGGLETARARAHAFTGVAAGLGESFLNGHVLAGISGRLMTYGRGMVETSPGQSADDLKDSLESGEHIGAGRGLAKDIGLMARTSAAKAAGSTWRLHAGVLVRDAGGTRIIPESDPSPNLDIKQTVNYGLGLDMATRSVMLRLTADFLDTTGAWQLPAWERQRAGAELWLTPALGISGGQYEGHPSWGIFADFTLLRFDLGTYTSETGNSHGSRPDKRYFARLLVGF